MANKVRIKRNSEGIRDLLRSPEVMAELKKRGDRIAAAAGEGYQIEEWVGVNRSRVTVFTATNDARISEARDHNLIRALDAGRGG